MKFSIASDNDIPQFGMTFHTGAPVRTMIDISEAMKPEDIIPLLANETIR